MNVSAQNEDRGVIKSLGVNLMCAGRLLKVVLLPQVSCQDLSEQVSETLIPLLTSLPLILVLPLVLTSLLPFKSPSHLSFMLSLISPYFFHF